MLLISGRSQIKFKSVFQPHRLKLSQHIWSAAPNEVPDVDAFHDVGVLLVGATAVEFFRFAASRGWLPRGLSVGAVSEVQGNHIQNLTVFGKEVRRGSLPTFTARLKEGFNWLRESLSLGPHKISKLPCI